MDLYSDLTDAQPHGKWAEGPPWILGHRGAPREAPENTLAGLRRAVDIGLDGFEYDLRACASGEVVLMHDPVLGRTTDASGSLAEVDLRELFGIDAGSWFSRRFTGETVPLFDEALEIAGESDGSYPQHMIELKESGLVVPVAHRLRDLGPRLSVRVASFARSTVLEARDADLPCMLLADFATHDDLGFCRDERVTAYGVGPGGWTNEAGQADWSFCERWGWSVDDPDELLEACRAPLFGFNTNEPHRALAVRALTRLAPNDRGAYPVVAPELLVEPEGLDSAVRARGEWYGSWERSVGLRNPFPFPVEVRCSLFFPSGAFESEGVPSAFELDVGEQREVAVKITGGARSPGPDPLFAALYRWQVGTVQEPLGAGGSLLLDAPLRRRRIAVADPIARRLEMLAERPSDPPASVVLRRQKGEIALSIENAGGLEDAHLIAHLDGTLVRSGRGVRLRLPADFDQRPLGVPFSCGIEGRVDGAARMRRWAGGLPEGLGHGVPGLVLPLGAS